MKIHEYQAKRIFSNYGIPTPEEKVCQNVNKAEQIAKEFKRPVVVKAQVLVGGRGKAGGIKFAKSPADAAKAAEKILGMHIKGTTCRKILISEAVEILDETYVGITIDRNNKNIIVIVSPEGGVDIEETAKVSPEKIFKLSVNPEFGLFDFQAKQLAYKLTRNPKLISQLKDIIKKLYKSFVEQDASLIEINPLVETPGDRLIALDAKINFDDNALWKYPNIEELRDMSEMDLKEVDAKNKGLSYIKLDGNIGCMVNGAGLAMATMDMISLYGGKPANFLDIGGSSNPQKVIDAMRIITSDEHVRAVLINIFGGITRCDDVATGIVAAFDKVDINIPVVVRLSGTNKEQGDKILADSNLIMAKTMKEAVQKTISLLEG